MKEEWPTLLFPQKKPLFCLAKVGMNIWKIVLFDGCPDGVLQFWKLIMFLCSGSMFLFLSLLHIILLSDQGVALAIILKDTYPVRYLHLPEEDKDCIHSN